MRFTDIMNIKTTGLHPWLEACRRSATYQPLTALEPFFNNVLARSFIGKHSMPSHLVGKVFYHDS